MTTTLETSGKKDKLTSQEEARLKQCERRIKKAQQGFFETCDALREIRDSNLYREGYHTINSYMAGRWEMSKPMVSAYLNAIAILDGLREAGFTDPKDLPQNEGQCRALAQKLGDYRNTTEVVELWKAIKEKGGKITAAAINEAIGKPKPEPKPAPKVEPPKVHRLKKVEEYDRYAEFSFRAPTAATLFGLEDFNLYQDEVDKDVIGFRKGVNTPDELAAMLTKIAEWVKTNNITAGNISFHVGTGAVAGGAAEVS